MENEKTRNEIILEISNDIENIIDFDEWAYREYGETKVDYYSTAINLYNAGYRKIKESKES